jgi:lipoprotein-anchoring transpeptidase ErfK/SrfK
MNRLLNRTILPLAAALLAACTVSDEKAGDTAAAAAPATAAPAPAAPTTADSNAVTPTASDMRIEVDLAKRQVLVYSGGQLSETHPVAVGSKEWPTQTGEWTIKQVVYNPEWIPPDESWAEEREPRKPGDPKNPLGEAQLVYDPPRTIHGTNQPTSVGKAVSHGSIRMRNEDLLALAPKIMAAGGAPKDEAWIAAARAKRTEKQIVDLPRPIPIKVF